MNGLSKKEKTRMTIMHAAKGLFERYGLDDVTVSQIAEEADVCRTTVFNHFSDTCELMLALISQEVEDAREHCRQAGAEGIGLIYALFDKLIEDAAYYPTLTSRLINNAILNSEEENPVRTIERITLTGLEKEYPAGEAQKLCKLTCGAFYGLINHYHVNNLKFDAEVMKLEFRELLALILRK